MFWDASRTPVEAERLYVGAGEVRAKDRSMGEREWGKMKEIGDDGSWRWT